jgi:hypothetical protein
MGRPYRELRDPIEHRGGSMVAVRKGHQWCAWTITLDGKTRTFESNGRGYPELDRLYVPKAPNPTHYTDYSHTLQPGAIDALVSMLR